MKALLPLALLCIAAAARAQDSSYAQSVNRALSLFDAGQYLSAGRTFDAAFRNGGALAGNEDRFNAARAWAAAGNADSAFYYLQVLAEGGWPAFDKLTAERSFGLLQKDSRWTQLAGVVQESAAAYGQNRGSRRPQRLFAIPAPAARLISVDELGNVYLVRSDNTLTRFNPAGDSTGFYRAVSNGPVGSVDATNPLRILVYYPSQSRLVLLDRMMALVGDLDLRRINLFSPPAVAYSADGNIWVYDPFNARLRKVNEQLTEVAVSNDLRQQTGFTPRPSFMIERERRLYMADSVNGVLVFDQFATYLSTIALTGLKAFQPVNGVLLYGVGGSLQSFHLQSFRSLEQRLPVHFGHRPVQALLARNRLYVLFDDALIAYGIPEDGRWQ